MSRRWPVAVLLAWLALIGAGAVRAADPQPLPEGALRRLGTLRLRHPGMVSDLAFSTDGKSVVSIGSPTWRLGAPMEGNTSARLWDVATGREIRRFPLPDRCGRSVAICPKGRVLASSWGSDKSHVGLFDLATGKQLTQFERSFDGLTGFRFLPDGQHLIANTRPEWKAIDGPNLTRNHQFLPIGYATTSPFQLLDLGGRQESLWLEGLTPRRVPASPDGTALPGTGNGCMPQADAYSEFSLSANGKRLAAIGANTRVWDLTTRKIILEISDAAEQQPDTTGPRPLSEDWPSLPLVALSGDGTVLAHWSEKGAIQIWSVESKRLLRSIEPGVKHLDRVAISPDGRAVAVGGWSADILVWDATTGKLLRRLGGHQSQVGARPIVFSPDGRTLATASWSAIRLWDLASGRELTREEGHHAPVDCLRLSSNGRTLESNDGDGTVAVWDCASGTLLRRYDPDRSEGMIAADPNRRLSWSSEGGELGPVRVRQVAGNKTVCELKNTARRRFGMNSEGYGMRIAAASADGKLVALSEQRAFNVQGHFGLWDGRTGDARRLASPWKDDGLHSLLRGESGILVRLRSILCFAFSADGARLAAGRDNGVIERWDTATGYLLPPLRGHQGNVLAVAFSPDGRSLASAGEDGTVCIWETATGQQRRCFRGHQGVVESVCFGAGGRIIASGGADTTVFLWEAWPAPKCAAKWSAAEQDALWADLANPDAAKAFQAMRRLAERPKPAQILLRERLRSESLKERKVNWIDAAMQTCGLRTRMDEPLPTEQLRALRAFETLGYCALNESSEALKVLSAAAKKGQ
jgi:WD40 repeat protein